MAALFILLSLGVSNSNLPVGSSTNYNRVMECTCGVNLQRWMTLYLKSLKVDGRYKYSIEKINNLPTVVGCTVSVLAH